MTSKCVIICMLDKAVHPFSHCYRSNDYLYYKCLRNKVRTGDGQCDSLFSFHGILYIDFFSVVDNDFALPIIDNDFLYNDILAFVSCSPITLLSNCL